MRSSGKERDGFLHEPCLPCSAVASDNRVAILENVGDDLTELLRAANEERILAEVTQPARVS